MCVLFKKLFYERISFLHVCHTTKDSIFFFFLMENVREKSAKFHRNDSFAVIVTITYFLNCNDVPTKLFLLT